MQCREADFVACDILANIYGTAHSLAVRIVFGCSGKPQNQFGCWDMEEVTDDAITLDKANGGAIFAKLHDEYTVFDEYSRSIFHVHNLGGTMHRSEEDGKSGHVYAESGICSNISFLSAASAHPTVAIDEELCKSEFAKGFQTAADPRVAIKHGHYDKPRTALSENREGCPLLRQNHSRVK